MFRHPGTVMSPEMTWSLKDDVAKCPQRSRALEAIIKGTPIAYEPKSLQVVDIDWGGKGAGHKECTEDGKIAYQSALLLWATDKKEYGDLCIKILKDWATKNKVFKGNNAPLEAAWSVCAMTRAAELIKYSRLPKVRDAWRTHEPVYVQWLKTVILPVLKEPSVWRWKFRNNWHFSILCARAQIAIFMNDRHEWDEVIKTYREILPRALWNSPETEGQLYETKRDLGHCQFLLGGLLQLPEIAYHQGVIDLYDRRLHIACEYLARLMLKEVPSNIKKEEINVPWGYWPEGDWEIGMAHFRDRCGLSMPKTEEWTAKFRPERVCFHWGGGTLTHYTRCCRCHY
jgi:hypothetical protein